jgi:hypothetical protein
MFNFHIFSWLDQIMAFRKIKRFAVAFFTAWATILLTPLMFIPTLTGIDFRLFITLLSPVAALFAVYMVRSENLQGHVQVGE